MKTLLDRVGAGALLLILSPVLLAVAALVRLTSRGPVLFVQPRVGRHERPFRMLKFRSMRLGAQHEEDGLESSAGGPFFKVLDDSRVTPLGRVLRRTSLDELPQLLNVLAGDMSLVGPRPLLPREHAGLPRAARTWRVAVKPGVTGLWQVSGRSATTAATRLRMDRLYVRSGGLALDVAILARTPAAVLRADGAV